MILKELKRHPLEYAVLVTGLAIILFSFLQAWPDSESQRRHIFALGVFYTLWGIWHHSREKTIQLHAVLEYVGLSVFAGLILWFALSY